jgi:hypothetical protein
MNSAQTKQITFASGAGITISMYFSGRGCSFVFETFANGKTATAFAPWPLSLAGHPEIVASVGKLALSQDKLDMVNAAIDELKATPEYAQHLSSIDEFWSIEPEKNVISY